MGILENVLKGDNMVMAFIFPILIGCTTFLLGVLAGRLSHSYKKVGRFVINVDDPTKQSAFWLEFDYDLDVLERQAVIGLETKFHHAATHSDPPEINNYN